MLVAMVASLQLHFVYLGMLHLNKTSTNVDVTNVGQGLGGGGGGINAKETNQKPSSCLTIY